MRFALRLFYFAAMISCTFFSFKTSAENPFCSQTMQDMSEPKRSTLTLHHLEQAIQYTERKRFSNAIESARLGLLTTSTEKSDFVDLHLALGNAYLGNRNHSLAYDSFWKAMNSAKWESQNYTKALYALIRYYRVKNESRQALFYADKALVNLILQKDKKIYSLQTSRGWILNELHDLDQAKQAFKFSLKDHSASFEQRLWTIHGLIITLIRAQKFEEALYQISEARQFEKYGSNEIKLKLLISELKIYRIQNDSAKMKSIISKQSKLVYAKELPALAEWKALVSAIQNDEILLQLLTSAKKFQSKKKFDMALKQYDLALKDKNLQANQLKQIYHEQVKLFHSKSDRSREIETYEKLLTLTSEDSTDYKYTYISYATSILNDGKLEHSRSEILEKLNFIVGVGKVDANFFLTNTVVQIFKTAYKVFDSDMRDQANAVVGRHSPFVSNSIFFHFFWGNYFLAKKDFVAAKKEFLNISGKEHSLGYAGLLHVAVEEVEIQEALQFYIEAKRLVGEEWYIYLQMPLSAVYNYVETNVDVRILAPLVERLYADLPEYQNVLHSILAYLYFKKGLYDEAKVECEKSILSEKLGISAHPEWPRLILAEIAAEKKDFLRAETFYKNALQTDPESILTYTKIAAFYQKTNRKKEALKIYKKVINKASILLSDGSERDVGLLTSWMSQAFLESGNILLENGLRKEALANFEKSLTLGSDEHRKKAKLRLAEVSSLTK